MECYARRSIIQYILDDNVYDDMNMSVDGVLDAVLGVLKGG